jgi:hypothetical protein
VKLRVDDVVAGPVRHLEGLETLALGLQGKLALWTALEALIDRIPELRAVNLSQLQQRARKQHAEVETRRLAAARASLANSASA